MQNSPRNLVGKIPLGFLQGLVTGGMYVCIYIYIYIESLHYLNCLENGRMLLCFPVLGISRISRFCRIPKTLSIDIL